MKCSDFQSEVPFVGFLPFQVIIGQTFQVASEPIPVPIVGIIFISSKGLISIEIHRSGHRIRTPQFQTIQPQYIFHKLFFMNIPTDPERIKGREAFRTTELGGPVHTIVVDVIHIPRYTDAPVERFGSGRFSIFLVLKSHR